MANEFGNYYATCRVPDFLNGLSGMGATPIEALKHLQSLVLRYQKSAVNIALLAIQKELKKKERI